MEGTDGACLPYKDIHNRLNAHYFRIENSRCAVEVRIKHAGQLIFLKNTKYEISHLLGGFGGVFLLSFSPVGSYGSRNSWSASDSTKQQWQTTQREPLSRSSRPAISGITAAEFVELELEDCSWTILSTSLETSEIKIFKTSFSSRIFVSLSHVRSISKRNCCKYQKRLSSRF
ncbi:hypothetical protein AVEN_86041-1 [Araneus ventricosus]|uniref:Uncharacterized protein n=1 Tax=Araneus ventricosus TaxID=182803 RepID=A0A4Y2SD15_ARAVE|nr:hypothetical protein AVEN_188162-1 [Araneus ventricosus]GBN85161.1 hypothetical protein AVEN_86041-1 [Araneus ventricosus]